MDHLKDKAASRFWNLDMVKRCSYLFDSRSGTLRFDWVELAGEGVPSLEILRAHKMLGPGRFIGVDTKPPEEILCGVTPGDDCTLLQGTLKVWMAKNFPAGVLNWDSFRLGGRKSFTKDLKDAFAFAEVQRQSFGMLQFLLIINAGLDRGVTLESFTEALASQGHTFVPQNCATYPGSKSSRINYAIFFGP